jgi:hypothetical protein
MRPDEKNIQVSSMAGVRRCSLVPCRVAFSPPYVGMDAMSWVAISQRPTLVLGFKPVAFAGVVLAAATTVAGLVLVMQSTGLPEYVDELTVENGTDFHLRIDVSDGEGESWLSVGTVDAETTKAFSRVIDQGEVWLFRFHGQRRLGGELRVDRSQLESDGWRMVVPESVADELRAQGALPPP